jgi:RNA polymerase sigma-70 factor (ECF subfamily)
MYRIAQNLWLDRTRARRWRPEVSDPEVIEALPGHDGRAIVEDRLTLEAVLGAMTELTPEQQVLVALVCIDGASYKEAAEITGTPIGTVMSRLARARRELHARLEPSLSRHQTRPLPDVPAATRLTASKAGPRL